MKSTLEQLMTAYLKERGIGLAYAKRGAGWRAVDADMAARTGFPIARPGIAIPYFHPLSREPHADLRRMPYFDPPINKETGKPMRYMQPAGAPAEAYFDPNIDWLEVMRNASIPIAITEGEAKALYMNQWALAEKSHMVTIGLGGVWNFRDKSGDLTPWLRMVRAASSERGREFIIAFDSDMAENKSIQAAARKLVELLSIEVRGVLNV
jgi:hypothetical protein